MYHYTFYLNKSHVLHASTDAFGMAEAIDKITDAGGSVKDCYCRVNHGTALDHVSASVAKKINQYYKESV